MTPTVHEIAPSIYRISTFIPELGPEGFSFNQFLIVADEPLLFHTGGRGAFPLIAEAVASIIPVESLRWISFGHIESDECGSMNMWLSAAPRSQVAFGALGCGVSLNDLCDRPPRALADAEVIDLGGKRVRQISTPHVPHGWEAQVMFEETTGTLLCGDLVSQVGQGVPITSDDVTEAALRTESIFHQTSPGPQAPRTLRQLAQLAPQRLAIMHGSSFEGDGRRVLEALANGYEALQRHSQY
ncbi:MAG TPA: MBL fold metallo-hydrolase [Polyangiaceae bacterium]